MKSCRFGRPVRLSCTESCSSRSSEFLVSVTSVSVPTTRELSATLRELAPLPTAHGTFNFVLSNGQALWAHCSTHLYHLVRQHPFATASLRDDDVTVDFAQHTTADDRVAVIVTEPLTHDEPWVAFAPGELRTFVDGAVLA